MAVVVREEQCVAVRCCETNALSRGLRPEQQEGEVVIRKLLSSTRIAVETIFLLRSHSPNPREQVDTKQYRKAHETATRDGTLGVQTPQELLTNRSLVQCTDSG